MFILTKNTIEQFNKHNNTCRFRTKINKSFVCLINIKYNILYNIINIEK